MPISIFLCYVVGLVVGLVVLRQAIQTNALPVLPPPASLQDRGKRTLCMIRRVAVSGFQESGVLLTNLEPAHAEEKQQKLEKWEKPEKWAKPEKWSQSEKWENPDPFVPRQKQPEFPWPGLIGVNSACDVAKEVSSNTTNPSVKRTFCKFWQARGQVKCDVASLATLAVFTT